MAIVQSLQNGTVNMVKSFNKDGNYLTTIRTYEKDVQNERTIIRYKKDNEEIGIIQTGQEKVAILDGTVLGEVNIVSMFSKLDNMKQLLLATMSKITTDNYGDIECYLIELHNEKIWVDKETGLIIREINGGYVSERFYEFDSVIDKDIEKPDISDCKII